MKNYPTLSKADSIIMDIIWKEKEVSSRDILNQVEETLGWSRQTVKTYLNRLQEKGMIGVNVLSPRVHIYYPLISREDYASEITSKYVKKYFGDLSHMMAGLIKREDISDEELDNLEQIIKEYRDKK
jgi:BlaI family penicillinase repressor